MTLYLFHFVNGAQTNLIYFNGNMRQPLATTYRLKLISKYTNRTLVEDGPSPSKYWYLEITLQDYNDRYTTFEMDSTSVANLASQFLSGIYNWELQWSPGTVENPSTNPNIESSFTTIDSGVVKIKTTASDNLAIEGPESEYFPTKHYQGVNKNSQSYVLYNEG